MKIYRYELDYVDQVLELPLGAEILSVAPGRGDGRYYFDMWAKVPEVAPLVPCKIWVFGTGHPMPKDVPLAFVGTVVMPDDYVFHVFWSAVR